MPKNLQLLARSFSSPILATLKLTCGRKKLRELVVILFNSAWRGTTTRLSFTELLKASWSREATQLVQAKAVLAFMTNLSSMSSIKDLSFVEEE